MAQNLSGRWRSAALVSTALLALAAPLRAEETPPSAAQALALTASEAVLLDTLVTAEGRRAPLQASPLAITALTSEQLDARAIITLPQLARTIPNFIIGATPGLGLTQDYTLRGLGGRAGGDAAVATFIDGVHVDAIGYDLLHGFDLDRVEVLRGPQGTLYDQGSIAGVVAVALAAPAERFGGYAELDYGNNNSWYGRASLDVPLGQGIGVKLSGFYGDQDGPVQNSVTGEALNATEVSGLRAALRVAPGSRLVWDAAIAYTRSSGSNVVNFDCDPLQPAVCNDRFSTTGLLASTPVGGAYNPYAPVVVSGSKGQLPLGNTLETLLVTSNLEWRGDHATLSLVTGIVDSNNDYAIDFADGRALPDVRAPLPAVHGYPSGGYTVISSGQSDSVSQDIRLSGKLWDDRLAYIVGGTFVSQRANTDIADVFNAGGSGIGTPRLRADRLRVTRFSSNAGYAQLDLTPVAKLTLTAGVRYLSTSQSLSFSDNRPGCAGLGAAGCFTTPNMVANGVALPADLDASGWLPRFVARWQASDTLMAYASASNGRGNPGWNDSAASPAGVLPYAASNVWSYELGLRSQWLDDRLRVNLTGFYIDASDVVVTDTFVGAAGALDVDAFNVPSFTNKGLELELIARPFADLNLTASLGYQDAAWGLDDSAPDFNAWGAKSLARQQRDCLAQLAAGGIPLGGGAPDCARGVIAADGALATPANAPAVTAAFSATYNFAVPTAGMVLSPSVNIAYRSAIETGFANATLYSGAVTGNGGQVYPANPFGGSVISGSHDDAALLVGAQLALETDDGNWLVTLGCDNCFDARIVTASPGQWSYLAAPLTWSIRARRSF